MFLKIVAVCVIFVVNSQFSHDDHDSQPLPYNFGYAVQDHHGAQYRKESGDGNGGVKGSYGYTDPNGIHREVHYIADHNGFRAQVKTNEPGTISGNPANVNLYSNGHHTEGHHQFHRKF